MSKFLFERLIMIHENQVVFTRCIYIIDDEDAAHQYFCQGLFTKLCMVLIAVLFVVKTACAEVDIVFPAGEYELVTNVSLPNLQANLANTQSRQSHCLHQHRASELFPILKHPSFTNCSLKKDNLKKNLLNSANESKNVDALFQLICQNNHAATGSAYFIIQENRFSAQLNIKMGAKNMTLIQHLNAKKIGPCHLQ